MDMQKIGVISLIKAAVTGEKTQIPHGFDIELALDTAKKHQITSMLYYGAEICGFDKNAPVMKKLFFDLCKCIAVSERQKFEVGSVCKAFPGCHYGRKYAFCHEFLRYD